MDNSKKELYIKEYVEVLREELSEQEILEMRDFTREQLESIASKIHKLIPLEIKEILDPADILEALRRLIASY